MPNIAFENFLRELDIIQIDDLNLVLKDQNGNIINQGTIGSLYNQILSLKSLKEAMNLATFRRGNELFTMFVGEESYSFYGEMFLRNIKHVNVGYLQNITKSNNLNIAQILYLILNIERVIFHN